MAKEILKDEILSDEELDNVNGGSYVNFGGWVEFNADMLDAKKRGIASFENLDLSNPDSEKNAALRALKISTSVTPTATLSR